MNNSKKLILLFIAFVVVLPISLLSLDLWKKHGTVKVNLVIVPEDANINTSSKSYINKDSIYIKPGKHTITISKDGFKDDVQSFSVSNDDNYEKTIFSTPEPLSDKAKSWVERNQDKYQKLEAKSGKDSISEGARLAEANPLISRLPIQRSIYSIGYRKPEESKNIIVTIDAPEGYRELALDEIRELGFNPSDYTIEFKNYRNPFNE